MLKGLLTLLLYLFIEAEIFNLLNVRFPQEGTCDSSRIAPDSLDLDSGLGSSCNSSLY